MGTRGEAAARLALSSSSAAAAASLAASTSLRCSAAVVAQLSGTGAGGFREAVGADLLEDSEMSGTGEALLGGGPAGGVGGGRFRPTLIPAFETPGGVPVGGVGGGRFVGGGPLGGVAGG